MNQKLIDQTIFRQAKKEECRTIAELFSIASDGVADYIWTKYSEPGENILDVGARRYSNEDWPFSYKNCVLAELKGEVLGMLIAFPIQESQEQESQDEESETDPILIDPILAPYTKLEHSGSYYICAMAVFDTYRGRGIGTKFLEIAERDALDRQLTQLSLIVFEQNDGALRLYERNGFYEIKREPIVPHELICYTGDALLMVKDIE
jgi:ribosomal protein S18 acetylase RimI-like enzyme